jgi:hypothetical protein
MNTGFTLGSRSLMKEVAELEKKTCSMLTIDEELVIVGDYKEGFLVNDIVSSRGLANSNVVTKVIKKHGVPLRKVFHKSSNHAPAVIDLDAEEAKLKARLAEIAEKKAALAIKFEWGTDEGVIIVHGVTPNFVKAGGMARLRAFIEREVPQQGGIIVPKEAV